MVWSAQTIPINKIKKDACPKIVNKKSETFAPKGPPKLFMYIEDVLLKKAGSEGSYETSAIKIYKEKAIKKKLKKLNSVVLK
jgi:hypothetical protein